MSDFAKNPKLPASTIRWYKILADICPVGIFFTDADGNCIHVNNRWCEISGMTPAQAMNGGWVQAIHEDDRQRVRTEWYDAARKKTQFHSQYRFKSKDTETWLIGDARVIHAEDGSVWGYIGTITDIDQTWRYYQESQEATKRVETIINHMPVILFAFDDNNNLCAWNHEAERVSGYSYKEMIGSDALKALFPDRQYRQEIIDVFFKQEDCLLNNEIQLTARNGEQKTLSCSNLSKYYQISGWKFWGVGVDLTQRKDVECTLRERIKELNCLYKLSILSGKSDLDLPAYLQEVVDIIPRSWQFPEISTARIVYENEIYTTDKFQKSAWKISSDIHVRGDKRGVIEVFYTEPKSPSDEGPFLNEERLLIDEISVQVSRTIERILDRNDLSMLDELSARADELDQFCHTVTHDLKIPLTAISGYNQYVSELLKKGDYDELPSCVDKINSFCEIMERRLEELLGLAKKGRVIEPTDIVNFNDLVADVVDLMEKKIANAGITLTMDNPFPLVMGDRSRLAEVLENLLDNAIKYIGQGRKDIHVGWESTDDDLKFFVQDTGKGIDPKNFESVFQLFKKLDMDHDGDGTGLAICKRIIEAHQGRIWVESEGLNKGTRFCFTLSESKS